MSENFTLPPIDLSQARTILAIQPHYDDNDLGAGGTIATLHQAGARILYLTVTDDQVGVRDPFLSFNQAETALRHEQDEAGRLIGVEHQYWLGYPDSGPIDPYTLRQDLIIAIRDLQPDVIFTVDPWLPYESHPDHVITGRAVSEAIGLYAYPRLKVHGESQPQYQPHPLLAVVYYFTHTPNTHFDVTSTFDLKRKAVSRYRMQFTPEEIEQLVAQIEDQARTAAIGRGFEFAEPLKVLHPTQLHIQTDTWKR
jgi:LmbE family N-acetylglucosaminyl deacetylase